MDVEDEELSHTKRRGVGKKAANQVRERAALQLKTTVAAPENWIERVPHFCPHCGGALWQDKRSFSAPKGADGTKLKRGKWTKNPRVALGPFIAKRYGKRLYLAIFDEIHELKSAGTDQG